MIENASFIGCKAMHTCDLRPRKDLRGADVIFDAVRSASTIGHATHRSRSDHAVIRVHNANGNVIETHEH